MNCKSTGSNNKFNSEEEYNIVKGLLSHLYDISLHRSDTIIIVDTILKFNTIDFKKSIDKFYGMAQYRKERNLPTVIECSDSIYSKFDFENILEHKLKYSVWDSTKIEGFNAKYKSRNNITWKDHYAFTNISLSHPLINKNLALIKGNKSSSGEIIYFLKKINGVWEVNCELYISQY